jgi:hypothetical protein
MTTYTATTKREKDDALTVGLIAAGIPALIIGMFAVGMLVGAWRAFVIFKLYGWFLTPLGAPLLNWWHIWGLLLIYSALKWKQEKADPNAKTDKPWLRFIGAILTPGLAFAIILLTGWLIKIWGLS